MCAFYFDGFDPPVVACLHNLIIAADVDCTHTPAPSSSSQCPGSVPICKNRYELEARIRVFTGSCFVAVSECRGYVTARRLGCQENNGRTWGHSEIEKIKIIYLSCQLYIILFASPPYKLIPVYTTATARVPRQGKVHAILPNNFRLKITFKKALIVL